MADLDHALEEARDALQREIRPPGLAAAQARATRLRHRRGGLTGATAALALMLVVALGMVLTGGPATAPDPGVASGDDPTGTLWSGSGLTVHGLDNTVLDLPGQLVDLSFTDAEHGYALAADCTTGSASCPLAVAATTDGGHTWRNWAAPQSIAAADALPRLVALPDGVFFQPAASGEGFYRVSTMDSWRGVTDGGPAPIRSGGVIGLVPDTCGGRLEAWQPDGAHNRLATAPTMTVCSVAGTATADGAWWVGGRTADDDAPAVAVTRDGGQTWAVTRLPAGPGRAIVSTLGNRVFASTVSERGGDPYPETLTAHAVYRSVDGGAFQPYALSPSSLIGEVVPLLDGRLLSAGPDWQLCDGGAFTRAGGSLPWVRRFERTPGAWVAYDLFRGGWAAISTDGVTWQKVNLR